MRKLMEVKEDVYKDVQEIFGRITYILKKLLKQEFAFGLSFMPKYIRFFFLKKKHTNFYGEFFLV